MDAPLAPRILSDAERAVVEAHERALVVEARGLVQVNDTGAIEKAVDELIAANPDKAAAVAEKLFRMPCNRPRNRRNEAARKVRSPIDSEPVTARQAMYA